MINKSVIILHDAEAFEAINSKVNTPVTRDVWGNVFRHVTGDVTREVKDVIFIQMIWDLDAFKNLLIGEYNETEESF